jgi:hypothetical protein
MLRGGGKMLPMPNIAYPPPRPLSAGEVLDLAFQIYRSTFVKCLLLSALGVIVGQLPRLYLLAKGQAMNPQELLANVRSPIFWALYALGLMLAVICYAAVLLRQRALITNGETGREVAQGLRRLPALLGLSILVGLSCVACILVPAALAGILGVKLAIALAVIPLSYIVVALLCAQTVLLVEGLGPVASYARSFQLTSGSYWRLSAVYTVGLIAFLALYFGAVAIGGVIAGIVGRGDVAVVTASGAVVMVAITALATPFYTALSLAVVGDLTARKDGADLERRISATA